MFGLKMFSTVFLWIRNLEKNLSSTGGIVSRPVDWSSLFTHPLVFPLSVSMFSGMPTKLPMVRVRREMPGMVRMWTLSPADCPSRLIK